MKAGAGQALEMVLVAILVATGSTAAAATPAPASRPASSAAAFAKPIDINSASRAQLKSLPGIGDAEADRIVANRPYLSKADLVSRQAIPAGVYQSIRHRIIAVQKAPDKKRRMSPSTSAKNSKG